MVNSQVTTVTLTADTPQEIRFSAAYPYIWVDNKSASNVYASVSGTPEADKDGTYAIAAGSQLRISGGAYNSGVTLLGEGKVQAIASAIASCPFKSASGGGDTKYVNGIPPVNGNIALTQSLIPSDGTAYQMPYFVQSGTVTVGKDANTVEITFPRAFKAVPTIVLGTTSIPTDTRYPIIATYNQASVSGFTLIVKIINSGGVAALNQSSTVGWAAFGELAEV